MLQNVYLHLVCYFSYETSIAEEQVSLRYENISFNEYWRWIISESINTWLYNVINTRNSCIQIRIERVTALMALAVMNATYATIYRLIDNQSSFPVKNPRVRLVEIGHMTTLCVSIPYSLSAVIKSYNALPLLQLSIHSNSKRTDCQW